MTRKNEKKGNVAFIPDHQSRILKVFERYKVGTILERKTIIEVTKIKKDQISVYLAREIDKGNIERIGRGLYKRRFKPILGIDDEKSMLFCHNIRLTLRGGDPQRELTDTNRKITSNFKLTQTNKKLTKDSSQITLKRYNPDSHNPEDPFVLMDKGGRKVETIFHRNSIEISIACSDNPLTFGEVGIVLEFLRHIFQFNWKEDDWIISLIEFNRDHKRIRLDGANCFSFTEFNDICYRFYNKNSTTLREELVASNIKLGEIIETFYGKRLVPGISDLKRQLKVLNREMIRFGKLNRNIADNLLCDISDLKRVNEELNRNVIDYQDEITDLRNLNEELNQNVIDYQHEINSLKKRIDRLNKTIKQQKGDVK
jgi:polyhydroxyalkanoate synthesis regulator phasin